MIMILLWLLVVYKSTVSRRKKAIMLYVRSSLPGHIQSRQSGSSRVRLPLLSFFNIVMMDTPKFAVNQLTEHSVLASYETSCRRKRNKKDTNVFATRFVPCAIINTRLLLLSLLGVSRPIIANTGDRKQTYLNFSFFFRTCKLGTFRSSSLADE